jgi:hypothetical protein
MPESPYRQSIHLAPTPADRLRNALLASLGRYPQYWPMTASTCYVWPSIECPVGCGHCNYASPVSASKIQKSRVVAESTSLIRIVNGMGLWKAVLSGGGEPMVEADFCAQFVSEVDSPNLAEIELITGAHFADSEAATYASLSQLVGAWRGRSGTLARAKFMVRLSVDWFHAQRIGVEPAANIIRMLGEPEFADVHCYIRSVLLDNDPTIKQLADNLNASLSELRDYQQTINLPDGRQVLVYSKNLIVEGRMNTRKLSRLPVGLPRESRAEEFGQRFRRPDGKHVPARTYNGPQVRHLDGLACLIDDQGMLRILEGSDVNRSAYIGDFGSWAEAIQFLYQDPLTVFLVENGPAALAALMADGFPDSKRFASDTNQLYHLTELLLSSPERRLFATLKVLANHQELGWQQVESDLLESSRQHLAQLGIAVRP